MSYKRDTSKNHDLAGSVRLARGKIETRGATSIIFLSVATSFHRKVCPGHAPPDAAAPASNQPRFPMQNGATTLLKLLYVILAYSHGLCKSLLRDFSSLHFSHNRNTTSYFAAMSYSVFSDTAASDLTGCYKCGGGLPTR